MNVSIESAQYDQFKSILALNEAAIPAVNHLDLSDLEGLAAQASYFKVAVEEQKVLGFLLMLSSGASYKSLNYTWFSKKYQDFAYVDRIVISPSMAGKGLGRRFYRDAIRDLGGQHKRICCEVNIKPRNDVSIAFHQALGFTEVGQQDTEGGSKRVSLLARSLSDAGAV